MGSSCRTGATGRAGARVRDQRTDEGAIEPRPRRPWSVRCLHDAQWHRPDRTRPRRPSPGRPLRPRERPVGRVARDPRGPRDGRLVPRAARPGRGAGPGHHRRRRRRRRGRDVDGPGRGQGGRPVRQLHGHRHDRGARARPAARGPRAHRGCDLAGRADRRARRAAAHRRRRRRGVRRRQRLEGADALRRAPRPERPRAARRVVLPRRAVRRGPRRLPPARREDAAARWRGRRRRDGGRARGPGRRTRDQARGRRTGTSSRTATRTSPTTR